MKALIIVIFCFFVFSQAHASSDDNAHDLDNYITIELHTKVCPVEDGHTIKIITLYNENDEDGEEIPSQVFVREIKAGMPVNVTWLREALIKTVCGGKWTEIRFYEPAWAVVD